MTRDGTKIGVAWTGLDQTILWTTRTGESFDSPNVASEGRGIRRRWPSVAFDEKGTLWCAWEESFRIHARTSNSKGSFTVSTKGEIGCRLPIVASSDNGLVGVVYQTGGEIVFRKLAGR